MYGERTCETESSSSPVASRTGRTAGESSLTRGPNHLRAGRRSELPPTRPKQIRGHRLCLQAAVTHSGVLNQIQNNSLRRRRRGRCISERLQGSRPINPPELSAVTEAWIHRSRPGAEICKTPMQPEENKPLRA